MVIIQQQLPSLPYSQPLVNSNLFHVAISFKWNYVILILFCLAYFTQYVFQIHLCLDMIRTQFLLQLKNIPLFVYTPFSLPIPLMLDTWVVSTCWPLEITVQRTLTYKYLNEFLFSVTWGVYLKGELLSHKAILYLAFCRTANLLSTVATSTYILILQCVSVPVSPSLHCLLLLLFLF